MPRERESSKRNPPPSLRASANKAPASRVGRTARDRSNEREDKKSGRNMRTTSSTNTGDSKGKPAKKTKASGALYGAGKKTVLKESTKKVSPAVKEAKSKGNAAFKDSNWDEAIKQYTRALKVDSKDHVCLANRSAAYLKKGQNDKALEDAERCIKMKPSYSKGHIRKAGALHALKKFTAEVKAYQAGLDACPGDELLKQGLDQAKRARSANHRASHAARRTEATMQAAKSVKKKIKRSGNVTEFVRETKKNIELQMAALEAQLDMVQELEKMKLEDKLELLFTLLDKDKSGTIDVKELADGLRKRNIGLSFGDAIEKSVELVAIYDENDDAVLDRDEFEHFVDKMVSELEANVDEFCEFLAYQLLFADSDNKDDDEDVDLDYINDEVKERGQLLDALHDPRMETLFVLFDRNGDGTVSFKEVACGLYHLTKDMEESAKATTGLLLMMDVDDKRVLAFENFAKLILAIAAAAGSSFEEVANDLTHALSSPKKEKFDRETMRKLTLAERDYRKARERADAEKAQEKIMDALSYGRTLRLFDLWDASGDGYIDFEELFAGLQRYQAAAKRENNVIIDAEKVAMQLMALDTDGDHQLDREEFATAMVTYADAMHTDLHQLIDFMCVVTALEKVI